MQRKQLPLAALLARLPAPLAAIVVQYVTCDDALTAELLLHDSRIIVWLKARRAISGEFISSPQLWMPQLIATTNADSLLAIRASFRDAVVRQKYGSIAFAQACGTGSVPLLRALEGFGCGPAWARRCFRNAASSPRGGEVLAELKRREARLPDDLRTELIKITCSRGHVKALRALRDLFGVEIPVNCTGFSSELVLLAAKGGHAKMVAELRVGFKLSPGHARAGNNRALALALGVGSAETLRALRVSFELGVDDLREALSSGDTAIPPSCVPELKKFGLSDAEVLEFDSFARAVALSNS